MGKGHVVGQKVTPVRSCQSPNEPITVMSLCISVCEADLTEDDVARSASDSEASSSSTTSEPSEAVSDAEILSSADVTQGGASRFLNASILFSLASFGRIYRVVHCWSGITIC